MTLLRLRPAAATHRGMRRRHNEDAVGYEYPSDADVLQTYGALFIVADGVGGLEAGDKASQMTVEELIRLYYQYPADISVEQRLTSAVLDVNNNVYKALNQKGATTLVAVVILNEQLILASAGDSQIFHIRDSQIEQLNEEDVLQSDDADNGALTKAIGYRESIEIETLSITLRPDEQVLLCSDGLTRYLNKKQLVQLAQLRDPRDSVRRMINQANAAGGADNISALLINVGEAIAPNEIGEHIRRISVRVAVDTDPMMMRDVPSKPTTQIPLSRPVPTIDESLLGNPELPAHSKQQATDSDPRPPRPTSQAGSITQSKPQSNSMIVIIVVAVMILAIGAVIFGIALASLDGDGDSGATPNVPIETVNTEEDVVVATIDTVQLSDDGIQVGDFIILDDLILTKNGVGDDVGSFLASADTPYFIDNITEDSEGQLWYLLLEEDTGQTGWLVESELPTFTIQRD